MTCNERIEKTLNRAGQTISDLPKDYLLNAGEAKAIQGVACRWFIDEDAPEGVAFRNLVSIPLYQYILHLTEIIDRMETALENVCGERDYLKYRLNWLSLYTHRDCPSCERVYKCDRTPDHCLGWAFGGVPEGWRADDENR